MARKLKKMWPNKKNDSFLAQELSKKKPSLKKANLKDEEIH